MSTSGPGARFGHAMVFDQARLRMVLFGGGSGSGGTPQAVSSQTFTLQADGTWVDQGIAGPTPRDSFAMVYDGARARIVLFGGVVTVGSTRTLANDTWEYDGSSWTQISTAQSPPPRADFGMTYDARLQRVVLFGGQGSVDGSTVLGDTWVYNGQNWSPVQSATQPPARTRARMFYNPVTGRAAMVGGSDTGPPASARWELGDAGWVSGDFSFTTRYPQMLNGVVTYDTRRNRLCLMADTLGELTFWDPASGNFSGVVTANNPFVLSRAAAAYDPVRDAIVVHGGKDLPAGGAGNGPTSVATYVLPQTAFPDQARLLPGDEYFLTGATVRLEISPRPATGWSYQWRRNGVPVSGAGFSGATTATLSISPFSAELAGVYDCRITASCNSTMLVSDSRMISLAIQPQISAQPADQGVCQGNPVALSVSAAAGAGPGPLSYQWFKNGNLLSASSRIVGTDTPTLIIDDFRLEDAGGYSVRVSQPTGTAWSRTAFLSLADNRRWRSLDALPEPRSGASMVFDSRRQRLVLYAGNPPGDFNASWEYDGRSWERRAFSTFPAPRTGYGLAFDEARGVTVLFGGLQTGGQSLFPDTWEYDGVAWRERTPAQNPPHLSGFSMAYDPASQRVVLFGGSYRTGPITDAYSDQTWAYDGVTWTQLPIVDRPFPRRDALMVTDPGRGVIVMVGGRVDGSLVGYRETWEYSDGRWSRTVGPDAANPTPARNGAALTYDAARGRVIMFGGQTPAPQIEQLNDVLEYTGTGWVPVAFADPKPPAEAVGVLAFNPLRGKTLLISGGLGGQQWELGPTGWTARGSNPPKPDGGFVATDSTRGVVVAVSRGQTWELTGGVWSARRLLPLAPASTTLWLFDDPVGARVLAISQSAGGWSLWAYSGTSWTTLPSGGTWPDVYAPAVAFDTVRRRIVVTGGYRGLAGTPVTTSETWEWDGDQWTLVPTASAPSPRYASSMMFDPVRGRVVLFGGLVPVFGLGYTSALSDTWTYDGTNWTQETVSGPLPPARGAAGLVFDPSRQTLVLAGGQSQLTRFRDTWELSASGWRQLSGNTGPQTSSGTLAYDPAGARLITPVQFGGVWEFAPASGQITQQPSDRVVALGAATDLSARADFAGTVSYRWFRGDAPAVMSARVVGTRSSTLRFRDITPAEVGLYRLMVSSTCGQAVWSEPARVATCVADFNADTAATIDDVFAYLAAWFARSPRADLTPIADEPDGVTIDDIFLFLNAWFAGC